MSSSAVRMICPNLKCRAVLSVPASARGKVVRCKNCGQRVNVPQAGNPTPTPTPEAAGSEKSPAGR